MYNWRLLLFALFALFQSIASFSERNLVDGRQQCCDHRFSRDTRFLDENYRSKLQSQSRRIDYKRQNQRDELRNENSLLIRPARDTARYTRDREERLTVPTSVSRLSTRRSQQMTYSFATNQNLERDTRASKTDSFDGKRTSSHTRIGNDRIAFDRRQDTGEKTENYRRLFDGRERYRTSNVRNSRDMRVSREANRGLLHQLDRTVSQNIRVSRLDRERSLTRDDSRLNIRTVRSADRASRNIVRERRLSFTDIRSDDLQRSSFSRDHRVDRERINTNRNGDRIESRQIVYQQEHRDTNSERNKKINPYTMNIRDQERRIERRVTRGRINVSLLSSDRVETTRRPEGSERRILNLDTDRRELKLASRIRTNIREHSTRDSERNRVVETERDDARQNSRMNNDERLIRRDVMQERRQISVDRRLENTRNERGYSDRRDNKRESRVRVSRSYDASREQRRDRTESIQRHVRSRSLGSERFLRSETRRTEVRNYEVEDRRTVLYDERRNRDKSPSERRLSSGRMAAYIMESKHINDGNGIMKRNNDNMSEQITAHGVNWQYLMYTIQGIYLCSILLPLLDHTYTKKNMISLGWTTPSQKLIKVD